MTSYGNPRNPVVIDDDIEMNRPIVLPPSGRHQTRLSSFKSSSMFLKPGKTAELINGDFLKIRSIWQNFQTTEITLTGYLLRRTRNLHGFISPKLNEICWMQDLILSAPFGEETHVALGDILRLRKLRMTNRPYDELNVSHTLEASTSSVIIKDEGVLFCRYKFTSVYKDLQQKNKIGNSNFSERYITALAFSELDSDELKDPSSAIDIDHTPQLRRSLSAETLLYTFADAFCGAGGMSCGAKKAGLVVKWGLERDENAARTYQKNFIDAICEVASVEQFIHFPPEEFRVDILHFSPPCQSFSPMQTRRGIDWEEKQVVILSIDELVKMVRPRIITMEEVPGLHFDRNIDFFATVVRTLISYGYSVRWKFMNMIHYGAPQSRRRLMLIAAGPNNPLPPFPAPTHLHNPATINSLISSIPTTATHHDLPSPFSPPRPPYNGNGPLRSLVDSSGGINNYHPSGRRALSVRELASLQTFPVDFAFVGTKTQIRRQIGNAVPPVAAKAVFDAIVTCLREWDCGGRGE